MTLPLVRDELPVVYADLQRIVADDGSARLASGLPSLVVAEGCGCGDDFCASFYTGARPRGTWIDEGDHRYLGGEGLVFAVAVVDDAIRYVEIITANQTDIGRRVAERLNALGRRIG